MRGSTEVRILIHQCSDMASLTSANQGADLAVRDRLDMPFQFFPGNVVSVAHDARDLLLLL